MTINPIQDILKVNLYIKFHDYLSNSVTMGVFTHKKREVWDSFNDLNSFQQLLLVTKTMCRVNRYSGGWDKLTIKLSLTSSVLKFLQDFPKIRVFDVKKLMTKYVLIRCDSSYSCVWWNTHSDRYRFVLLVDLSVACCWMIDFREYISLIRGQINLISFQISFEWKPLITIFS